MRPYGQVRSDRKIIRWFSGETATSELKWHRDGRDRHVRIIDGAGWQLQFDDSLPISLAVDSVHFIPKNEWHRLLMGDGSLVVEITET